MPTNRTLRAAGTAAPATVTSIELHDTASMLEGDGGQPTEVLICAVLRSDASAARTAS